MDIIGTKQANAKEAARLKPLTVNGRPTAYPGKTGLTVVFGYDKKFSGRVEEALAVCESLADMQYCHEKFVGKTRTVWYTLEVSLNPGMDLVEVSMDEIDIMEDFEGQL